VVDHEAGRVLQRDTWKPVSENPLKYVKRYNSDRLTTDITADEKALLSDESAAAESLHGDVHVNSPAPWVNIQKHWTAAHNPNDLGSSKRRWGSAARKAFG